MAEAPKPITHRRIGYCIYCGYRNNLTREHVVPAGLGGRIPPLGTHAAMVLKDASCEVCREITQKFETTCQLDMFGLVRTKLGMVQGSAPLLREALIKKSDGTEETIRAPLDDLPIPLVMPHFAKQPSIFLPEGSKHKAIVDIIYKWIAEPQKTSPYYDAEVGVTYKWDADAYQKMLAKIALAAAILQFGTDSFRPIVCDFIRGEEKALGKYVFGFDLGEEPSTTCGEDISIKFRRHRVGSTWYLIGFVRFFAQYGAPTNGVVVGVVKDDALDLFPMENATAEAPHRC